MFFIHQFEMLSVSFDVIDYERAERDHGRLSLSSPLEYTFYQSGTDSFAAENRGDLGVDQAYGVPNLLVDEERSVGGVVEFEAPQRGIVNYFGVSHGPSYS